MKKAIISAKDLCKSFAHNGGQVHIIQNVDLEIYEGDFTIIMGSSGSGKSTLLYALSGMDRATSGRVELKGENITDMSEKELAKLRHTRFGFVFQQINLVSNLSLFENVAVPGYLNKNRSSAEVNETADRLLKKMGISDIKTQLPSQCSGGEQQRCAIARALIKNPKLLLCDEPTGALDSKTSRDILMLLEKINAKYNTTMLIVTHNNSIKNMVHKVIFLKDGLITKDYLNETRVPAAELEDL